jgi:hypothetical protein
MGGSVVALALWLGAQGGGDHRAAAAAPLVHGSVAPSGVAWGVPVERIDVGRYRIPLEHVDVVTWDGLADVVIVPVTDAATEVRFLRAGVPVDAGFSYTASAG